MSFSNKQILLTALFAIALLLITTSIFFPTTTQNLITGFASIAGFNVSISIIHAEINILGVAQLDPVIVEGSNITLRMPVTYYDNITMNLTIDKPAGYECGYDWYINESGVLKNITVNNTELSWLADKSIKNTSLYFDVSNPTITTQTIYTGDSYYENTFTIYSCCPLTNASANITANSDYDNYMLYEIINNTLVNKTQEYHLEVSNTTASFHGFNLSNKTFRLKAEPDEEVVQQVVQIGSSGGGGSGGAMPLINYSTDQQFIVEPNYLSITTSEQKIITEEITIYNLRGVDKDFNITYTNNFIYDVPSTISVPHKEFEEIPINKNTQGLNPGVYTDYVYVKTSKREEKVTVKLNMEEPEIITVTEQEEEEAAAETQQPRPIQKPKEKITNPIPSSALIITGIIILIISVAVLIYKRSKTKIIRF